ncbi:dienelactone hydrolase family protein [Streptomyces sp. NPDC051554]|uniref:dienelactone hydrolase family protein n=1 Tax=Streptomyces sp. NPDC051554 TaxID=3365656 RepID=UPI0037B34AFC
MPGGRLEVAEIRLGGSPRGVVVVGCEAGGMDRDAADVMNRLAEHGYASIAADLSARGSSDGELVTGVGSLLSTLADQGWSHEQVGVIGYGFGGRVAFLAATAFELGASVSVSPRARDSVRTGLAAAAPRTPWLGLFGECGDGALDPTPTELRAAWAAHTAIVTYPVGDFYRDSADPAVHAAAFDSWQRTVEWLNLRVAPRPTPLALAWRENGTSRAG